MLLSLVGMDFNKICQQLVLIVTCSIFCARPLLGLLSASCQLAQHGLISIKIHTFSPRKMHLKMLYAIRRSFCAGLNCFICWDVFVAADTWCVLRICCMSFLLWLYLLGTRGCLDITMLCPQYRDSHYIVDRLIFMMGIPIPRKDALYIETGPRNLFLYS